MLRKKSALKYTYRKHFKKYVATNNCNKNTKIKQNNITFRNADPDHFKNIVSLLGLAHILLIKISWTSGCRRQIHWMSTKQKSFQFTGGNNDGFLILKI